MRSASPRQDRCDASFDSAAHTAFYGCLWSELTMIIPGVVVTDATVMMLPSPGALIEKRTVDPSADTSIDSAEME